ncbi:MAG: aspartate aminotransferase family protein [Candidatus Odyssella sp.]|nr:aspartate aminotransferase family protein [Candidatus Odyssella sp.]
MDKHETTRPPTPQLGVNTLEPYWMPFTGNRHFKQNPRLLAAASGMYYTSDDGRKILDGCAGLWCVNAGHGRAEITEAIRRQAGEMDYAPSFQLGHPIAFELASRITANLPGDLDHVFYCNSGSEAVDTALKIALAYHQAKGDHRRTRLIGRERGYHGVGFGGISVGGIVGNRRAFASALLPQVDHLPHTHDLAKNAFSRGQPEHGAQFAEALEQLCALHDPATIAAVIVEPVAGSTGVLVPPKGYLEALRRICDKHGILLIFDEVITGFGRLGAPFAAEYFGVLPDLMTVAKGLTNAAVPMGAVFARKPIYEAFMQGPENAIELFHGYTYSGHPLACAAALAAIEIHRREDLAGRARAISGYWADAIHSLRDARHVIDLRNLGLIGAIELAPRPGAANARAFEAFLECFRRGLLIRVTGDTIALSPPLIVEKPEIDRMVETIRTVLAAIS